MRKISDAEYLATRAKKAEANRAYQARFRESHPILTFTAKSELRNTLDALAARYEVSRSDVINSLIRFALTNRNFETQGLYQWKKSKP